MVIVAAAAAAAARAPRISINWANFRPHRQPYLTALVRFVIKHVARSAFQWSQVASIRLSESALLVKRLPWKLHFHFFQRITIRIKFIYI